MALFFFYSKDEKKFFVEDRVSYCNNSNYLFFIFLQSFQNIDMSKRSHDSGEVDDVISGGSKKAQKVSSHEIQVARETAELFKSNIFKLQIDQLIQELKLKPSHCLLIEKVLHKLHSIILEIPETEDCDLQQAQKLCSNVKIPFPDPVPSNIQYTLKYLPPQDINLVGSFGLKTGIKQSNGMSIDVAVSMPKELFTPKDYLNYRVLHKKSFYLAYLTSQLEKLAPEFGLPIELEFDYHNGDKLTPCLIIRSKKDSKENEELSFKQTKFSIKLLIGLPFGQFDSKKLLPDKNCIRIQGMEIDDLPPTPLYNASILSSSTYVHYLKYLYTTKRSTEAFKDAACLAKLWLNQRGLSSHVEKGGFGHFEFVALMAALLEGGGDKGNKILLHGYSSYQLFKGTIKYLAEQDLSSNGYLSFSSIIGEGKSHYKSAGFDTPTLFDKNTKINLLWKMTNSSYKLLKNFAAETLSCLNDLVFDKFNQIFILNNTIDLVNYDHSFTLPYEILSEHLVDDFNPLNKVSFITLENFIKSKLDLILTKALGDRLVNINIHLVNSSNSFPLNKRKSNMKNTYLFIGLNVDSRKSENKLVKGPLYTEESLGNEFEAFWGSEVAQLRRFKDGTVQWSCLFESNDEPVLSIIKYILNRHLNPEISKLIHFNSNKFFNVLPKPVDENNSLILPSQTIKLQEAFANLVKTLQRLSLPINIKSVLPISTNLRSTSIVLPIPFAIESPNFWNDAIIHFDNSSNGKWPKEIFALEDTKTAILLKIQSLLPYAKSFIVEDDSLIAFNTKTKLLRILTHEGFGFQLRIVLDFEESIYLSMIDNCDVKQKKILENVYLQFYRESIGKIKHHRTLQTFIQYYPMLSSSIRLFKIWLDKHLLLNHFNEELIELLVLNSFVNTVPYGKPNSPMSGFLYTLKFLSTWNWVDDALILDLSRDFNHIGGGNNDMTKYHGKFTIGQYKSIQDSFTQLRKQDPKGFKLPYFIVTKDDLSGKIFTFDVLMVMANRLTQLSKLVIDSLGNVGLDGTMGSKLVSNLFTSSLDDYQIIINLKHKADDKMRKSGIYPNNVKFKNLIQPPAKYPQGDIVIAGEDSDPCFNLYQDIKARFQGIVWGFEKYHGLTKYGQASPVIVGSIMPGHFNKKFRVGMGYDIQLDANGETISMDLECVCKTIALLGGELVDKVTRK